MHTRHRLASGVPALLLRIVLAVTFIWAGLGKILAEMPVSGARAAALANMGVKIPGAPEIPRPTVPSPAAAALETDGAPSDAMPADGFRSLAPGAPSRTAQTPAAPAPPAARYHAWDFPEPVNVRRLHGVALRIHSAAHPETDADGNTPGGIWPVRLAQGSTPVYLAYAVAITETLGGIMLLVGMLTRIWALAIAGVMFGAIWLDQIGPAVQAGQTMLGFLPERPTFDPEGWRPLLWQFSLVMSALAVVFSGPGMLALDNVLFGRRRSADDDDDEA